MIEAINPHQSNSNSNSNSSDNRKTWRFHWQFVNSDSSERASARLYSLSNRIMHFFKKKEKLSIVLESVYMVYLGLCLAYAHIEGTIYAISVVFFLGESTNSPGMGMAIGKGRKSRILFLSRYFILYFIYVLFYFV